MSWKMPQDENAAKFWLAFAARTDTMPFYLGLALTLAVVYFSRRHRQRELEAQAKERSEQKWFIGVMLVSACFVVPAATFMKPDNPEDTTNEMPSTVRSRRTKDVDAVDVLIGVTVVAIVIVVTFMVWPITCDGCAPEYSATRVVVQQPNTQDIAETNLDGRYRAWQGFWPLPAASDLLLLLSSVFDRRWRPSGARMGRRKLNNVGSLRLVQ